MSYESFLSSSYHSDKWYKPGGWQELMLVGAAVKLDIFKALAPGARTASNLAQALGLNERAVTVFLQALAGAGYVAFEDGLFLLTPQAFKKFGDERGPEYLGWAVLHTWRLAQRWLTLPETLTTGEPVPGDRFSETVEGFVRAMDVYAAPTAEQAVDVCLAEKPDAAAVLDIGGATGTVSKLFARHGLRATLFDLPEVIETVKEEIGAVYPTIVFAGGDFNSSIPPGPYDIVFLGNVTHIYGPDKNLMLFRRIQEQLNSGGLVAIQDYVRGMSPSAPFFGVNMLVNTVGGGAWSEDQYTDWLRAAGFGPPSFLTLAARDQQLIIAKRQSL